MKKKQLFVSAMAAVCATAALAGGLVACGDEGKSDALSAPAPTLSGAVVSWKAVKGAQGYVVTVNGREYNVEDTTYTIRATEVGEYSVYVTAVKGSDKKTSKKLTYTLTDTLDAPELSLNGNVVAWNAIAHAASYEVYVNDELETTVTEARYVITEEEVGTYVVRAKSVGENKYYINSDLSDAVTYKVENSDIQLEKLTAPTIALNKRTVSWTAVEHATGYKVYIDGAEAATVSDGTSYDIMLRSEGNYRITVAAIAPATDFVQSDASNAVTFTVAPFDFTKPIVAYITGNGATVGYSSDKNMFVQSGSYDDSGSDAAFLSRAWRLIPAGNYYKIKVYNGAFLTSASGKSNAWYAAENGGDGQLWELRERQDGGYYLLNKAVGEYCYCADTKTDALHFFNIIAEGNDIQVWKLFNVDVQFDADMDVLDAPELSLDGNVVSWTAVDGADEYKVYVNGEYKTTVTETSYTVQATVEGLYTVTVVAVGEGALDSVPSNGAAYMHSTLDLAEPVYATYTTNSGTIYAATCDDDGYVTITDASEITDFAPYMWYMEKNGEYYKIKFADGNYLTRVANGDSGPEGRLMPANDGDSQLWKLVADGFNKYKLQNKEHIAAYGNNYFYGEWYSVFKFADACYGWDFTNKDIQFGTAVRLAAPILSISENVVTWTAVENATAYDIYVDGKFAETVSELSYTIVGTEQKLYTVKVRAKCDGYEPSFLSDAVSYMHSTLDLTKPLFASYSYDEKSYVMVANDEGYIVSSEASAITDFAPYMWYLEKSGEFYKIKFANGWYLTRVANGDTNPEALLAPANDGDSQLWKLVADGFNKYKLQNKEHMAQWGDSFYFGETNGIYKFLSSGLGWAFTNMEIEFNDAVFKLAAPTVTLNGDTAAWEAVDNATGYDVYINGIKVETVTALTYTMQNSGDVLKVKAVSTAANTEASYFSNSVTYTNLFAAPVVAYYSQNNGAKTLGVIGDDGTLEVGAEYTTISDYSDYLWTFEKLENGNYMIKLADGRYLSYYDNPNSGDVAQTIAAEKNVADEKQQWKLIADGDSGTRFKLENVHLSHYYQNVYLGEWFGVYKFNGGCNAWTFFNPDNN